MRLGYTHKKNLWLALYSSVTEARVIILLEIDVFSRTLGFLRARPSISPAFRGPAVSDVGGARQHDVIRREPLPPAFGDARQQ